MLSAVPAAGAAAQSHVPREDTARLEHPRWSVRGAVAYDWRGENSGGGDDYPTDTFAFDLGVRRVAIRGVGFEIAAGVALAGEDAGHRASFMRTAGVFATGFGSTTFWLAPGLVGYLLSGNDRLYLGAEVGFGVDHFATTSFAVGLDFRVSLQGNPLPTLLAAARAALVVSWAFGSAKGEEAEIRDPTPAAASGSQPDGSFAAP